MLARAQTPCKLGLHCSAPIEPLHAARCRYPKSLLSGASTRDIIRQYVATIRALLEVDPGGGLLEAIGPPVRAYLRGRHDAVRCVVAALTGDDGDASGADSLLEELAQPPVPEVRAPVLKLSG